MKNLLSFIVLTFFSLQLAVAQPTPPETPQTSRESSSSFSTSSSQTKININMGDDQKLKLSVDDHDFDMDLDFGDKKALDLRRLLTKHLGTPKVTLGGAREWSDKNRSYKVKLRKGSLEASFDKDELSSKELEKLMSFAKDVFDELGWDIDVDGL